MRIWLPPLLSVRRATGVDRSPGSGNNQPKLGGSDDDAVERVGVRVVERDGVRVVERVGVRVVERDGVRVVERVVERGGVRGWGLLNNDLNDCIDPR